MNMRTISDLVSALRSGVAIDVELAGGIADQESYAETGMRGRLVRCHEYDEDVIVFSVDLKPYDRHNDTIASPYYYDASGVPCLTGKEAGYFPKDGIEEIYVGADAELEQWFILLCTEQITLYQEFLESDTVSYVGWLEKRLLVALQREGGRPA